MKMGNTKRKRIVGTTLYHALILLIGLMMVYPLIWMVMSSFKETNTIFTTAGSLIPKQFTLENYINGWKGFAKITFVCSNAFVYDASGTGINDSAVSVVSEAGMGWLLSSIDRAVFLCYTGIFRISDVKFYQWYSGRTG